MLPSETCECDHETERERCVCYARVPRGIARCGPCRRGEHRLEPKPGFAAAEDTAF